METGRRDWTRRRFIGTAGAAGVLARTGLPAFAEERTTVFEGPAPGEVMEELDDNRLLVTLAPGGRNWAFGPLCGVSSSDAGRTWTEPFPYLQSGKPFEGALFPARAMVRLRTGGLGLVYSLAEASGFGYTTRRWLFATSSDEGRNWSAGHPMDAPAIWDQDKGAYLQFPWGDVIELSRGRLLCPAYWYMGGRHPETPPNAPYPTVGEVRGQKIRSDGHLFEGAMGGCYAYLSDDNGRTWRRSTGSNMVWPIPGEKVGGFGCCWEPVALELKEGRVLMLLRTNVGRIYQSISQDGGDRWSLPQPTELPSGDVPCALGRLKTTGDLVVVWNQSSEDEIRRGYSRGRLSLALSSDEGNSWGRFRTIARSEGLAARDRVEPGPIRHARVEPGSTKLPDGYARYHYPGLAFVQQSVVLVHRTAVYDASSRSPREDLKVIPEASLYR